jgi:hypothetical protein
MNLSTLLALSIVCFLAFSQASAAAEKVYKWTDAKGQTHYGQRPPLNTETEVIKTRTGHSDPVNYEAAPGSAPNVPKDKEDKKAEANSAPPKDKERCDLAHKNADTLKTYAHIRIKGDDGEYRFLTPDEQKQKLDEASKAIEESCD